MKSFSLQVAESFVCFTHRAFVFPSGPTADRKFQDSPRHQTWIHDVPLDGEKFLRLSRFWSELS